MEESATLQKKASSVNVEEITLIRAGKDYPLVVNH